VVTTEVETEREDGAGWEMELAEHGWVPDPLLRMGIRARCAETLVVERERQTCDDVRGDSVNAWVAELRDSAVAVQTDKANEQHYELPTSYFEKVLGKRLKYSATYWPEGCTTLDESEEHSLAQVCERVGVEDGMRVLDMGCGWGSFSLYCAEHFPNCSITSVSNSAVQRQFIEARAAERGLDNVTVITCDMNTFEAPVAGGFDRAVTIEMFEHMRNYEEIFERVSRWLKPGGRIFVHIFTHKQLAYPFRKGDDGEWMAKYFFSGGQMPSDDLLLHFQDHLKIVKHWRLSGTNYEKTSNAWLVNHDANKAEIMEIFNETYGPEAMRWFHRWRLFYLACAELFGYDGGEEWIVSHYLFERRDE